MSEPEKTQSNSADDFARQAQSPTPGAGKQLMEFLFQNKKWWLLPIVLVLLMMGLLLILSGTAAAPLIYTLF